MRLLTGLFRAARKRLQVVDGADGFRDKITELVEKRDSLSEEGINERVDELITLSDDLPDGEDKEKLKRFLEDVRGIKEQDEATAKEAVSMVADLFEKLDGAADAEVSETVTETEATDGEGEVKPENKPETKPEAEPTDGEGEPEKEKEKITLDEETKEDLYQFIKKRMSEDACKDEALKDEGEDKITTDGAPRIAVSMSGNPTGGSLSEMFAKIKNGGR
jgi:pyruvate-formate lyase